MTFDCVTVPMIKFLLTNDVNGVDGFKIAHLFQSCKYMNRFGH